MRNCVNPICHSVQQLVCEPPRPSSSQWQVRSRHVGGRSRRPRRCLLLVQHAAPALDGIDDDDANQHITAILDGGGELPPLQDAEPCEAEAPRDDHVGLQPIRDDASSNVSSRSQAEAEEEAAPAVMHGLKHFCKNYTVVLDLMKKYMIVFLPSI